MQQLAALIRSARLVPHLRVYNGMLRGRAPSDYPIRKTSMHSSIEASDTTRRFEN